MLPPALGKRTTYPFYLLAYGIVLPPFTHTFPVHTHAPTTQVYLPHTPPHCTCCHHMYRNSPKFGKDTRCSPWAP